MSGGGQETSRETAAAANTRQTSLALSLEEEPQEDWKFLSGSVSASSSGRPAGSRQRAEHDEHPWQREGAVF